MAAADSATPEGSFGDVFNALICSLPSEASGSFLRCLSGLTAEESNLLSMYLLELKDEKKFRVIQALMDAPVSAKKRYILSLRDRFERLKAKQAANGVTVDPRARLERSGSRQSSMKNVTTDDIKSMGHMLDNAHIGESELRLQRLEEEKEDVGNWELLKGDATPAQRAKEDGSSDEDPDDDDDEVEAENSPDADANTEVPIPFSNHGPISTWRETGGPERRRRAVHEAMD
ncbi:hypothetical protein DYB31_012703 [Aphanomyces astaci]|uniref:Uncharacterized protein n=1 Tax=Aphanomyces astaci TaxID=112090 RepID=A0A397FMK1_APHAT|nr:hypothetical protein DYB31_012703 [Aphanomyces astaci]